MSSGMQALGYVEVTTRRHTILGPAGRTFRGHQFRYSTLQWKETPHAAYDVSAPPGQCRQEGYSRGCVLGSYVHAHWSSSPETADSFVEACAETRAA
jgi:cobyrinic acid a,c-diamide synthase